MTAQRPSTRRTRSIDLHDVHSALSQIASPHNGEPGQPDQILLAINRTSVDCIPGAQYAGITVIDHGAITTLGATHDYPRHLDDIQRDTNEGPCLSAAWNQHTIHIDDLTTDDRWPRYRDAVLCHSPIRSVTSFRLYRNGQRSAALNFYAHTAGVFDEESVELGLIFAAHTALAWNLMEREQQFKSALASRDTIGQAKGMLMERFAIDAYAAFTLLRRLSQESNTKLVDIAEQIITADHPSTST